MGLDPDPAFRTNLDKDPVPDQDPKDQNAPPSFAEDILIFYIGIILNNLKLLKSIKLFAKRTVSTMFLPSLFSETPAFR
jgi:hypothetical protein